MKHIIRCDIEIDIQPIDEGMDYGARNDAYRALEAKYKAKIAEDCSWALEVDNMRTFPIRYATVEDGRLRCPFGHEGSITYFEDVLSVRGIASAVVDNTLVIDSYSEEGDGEPDILSFACTECGFDFRIPEELDVEWGG